MASNLDFSLFTLHFSLKMLTFAQKLYITKDPDTLAFFQRFDRVIINGQPWEIQAYNDNYGSSSSNIESGIIRVALKETYTSTAQQIRDMDAREQATDATITGPDVLSPYDEVVYTTNSEMVGAEWSVSIADEGIISYSVVDNKLKIVVNTTKAYRQGFTIQYGDLKKKITIKSL